jgi:thioredoxin 1
MQEIKSVIFFNDLIRQNDDVLVEWFTTWCGPCRMLLPVLEETELMFPNIVFAKVDAEAQLEISKEYGVASVPTLIRFKNGKPVFKVSGYKSKDAVIKLLTD